jgi:hypothetical protein
MWMQIVTLAKGFSFHSHYHYVALVSLMLGKSTSL